MARRLDGANADGFVLFNRSYQPDINLDSLRTEPILLLSTSPALGLPLTWLGMLYGRILKTPAGSGGGDGAEDVVRLSLARLLRQCSYEDAVRFQSHDFPTRGGVSGFDKSIRRPKSLAGQVKSHFLLPS
jgi:hypothetical protein